MIALTHLPSPHLQSGERTHVPAAAIDPDRALKQHAAYRQALEACGARVVALESNCHLPDATFIEDTAVILDEVAIVASPGAASRRPEIENMVPVLSAYRAIERIELPATLEGGDVLRVGRRLLVGMSSRTNPAGIAALAAIARRLGYTLESVAIRGCLHLKTACTALPDGRLLTNRSWMGDSLPGWTVLPVPAEEPWAANLLLINGQVLASAAHGRTAALINDLGFQVLTVEISEFAKAEGGVTCLSLLLDEL